MWIFSIFRCWDFKSKWILNIVRPVQRGVKYKHIAVEICFKKTNKINFKIHDNVYFGLWKMFFEYVRYIFFRYSDPGGQKIIQIIIKDPI